MSILRYRETLPETLVKVYNVKEGANEDDLSNDDFIAIGYYFFESPKSLLNLSRYYPIVSKSEFKDTDFFDDSSGTDIFRHYCEKI